MTIIQPIICLLALAIIIHCSHLGYAKLHEEANRTTEYDFIARLLGGSILPGSALDAVVKNLSNSKPKDPKHHSKVKGAFQELVTAYSFIQSGYCDREKKFLVDKVLPTHMLQLPPTHPFQAVDWNDPSDKIYGHQGAFNCLEEFIKKDKGVDFFVVCKPVGGAPVEVNGAEGWMIKLVQSKFKGEAESSNLADTKKGIAKMNAIQKNLTECIQDKKRVSNFSIRKNWSCSSKKEHSVFKDSDVEFYGWEDQIHMNFEGIEDWGEKIFRSIMVGDSY